MTTSSMSRPFSLGPWLLRRLPRRRLLARVARAYLSRYRGDNNVWADSNGEFDLIRAAAPLCRVILDVGANVGDWTREALSSNPGLTIHCFEAAPDNFAVLAGSELAERIVLNHVAVSDSDGEIELTLFGEHSPLNSIVVPGSAADGVVARTIAIKAVALDTYLAAHDLTHVDYVKIDVEGAEARVIAGLSAALEAGKVDAVQFEHGPFSIYDRTFLKDYFDLLQPLGFSLYKVSQPKMLKIEHYDELLDNFSHQNWVAARHGTALHRLCDQRSAIQVLV